MDKHKQRVTEALNTANNMTPELIAQGSKKSTIVKDPADDNFCLVTGDDGKSTRVAVSQVTADMDRMTGLTNPAQRAIEIDKAVQRYSQGVKPAQQANGMTPPKPMSTPPGNMERSQGAVSEAAKKRAERQNNLHKLFEGGNASKDKGAVKVSLFHDNLLLIECSRQSLFDKLMHDPVAETPNPTTLSFYVAYANAPALAESLTKLDVRIKNAIRKVTERKAGGSIKL